MKRVIPNLRPVVVLKALEYVGLALFTFVVPRTMGPESYGSFAAVLAMVGLLTMSTGLGAHTTFGRFVPEYIERGDHSAISRLYTQLLAVRVGIAVPLGGALSIAVILLLPELGLRTSFFVAGAFIVGAVGMTGYQLLFGLNRLAPSMLATGLSRLLLAMGVLGIGPDATPSQAVEVLFWLELGLATLALVWAAPFFDGSVLRSSVTDVREALRFGAVFLAASLLLATVWRAGEVVITVLSASRAEISFYSIASAIAMAVAGLLGQVTALLIPTVTVLHLRGESRRFEDWMATSLRYMTIMSCVVIIGVFTASDWVFPMILGPGFERVSLNLKILSIGLVPLGLVRTAYSVAVVHKAARQVVLVGIEGVAAFLLLTAILVPGLESLGASIAVTTAFFVSGARSIQRMELATIVARSRLGRSLAPAVALALLWVPLLPRLMAGGLALATYLGVATALGVIRADELRLGQRRLFGRSTEQPNSVREEVVDAPI